MSRLLFAAARGARVQYEYRGKWFNTPLRPSKKGSGVWRTHPDDEHLQYGPISTALRAWAFLQEAGDYALDRATAVFADYYEEEPDWGQRYTSELHRSLFLLILSEALADEGL